MDHAHDGQRIFAARVAIAASLLVAMVGCGPGGDPVVAKAQEVFLAKSAANPQYRDYGLSLIKDTRSPWLRQQLYAAFEHENFRTAMTAVEALGDETPPDAVEPLTAAFAAKKGALKLAIATHLAAVGNAEALTWLDEQVSQPGMVPSVQAVKVLAANGKQEQIEGILAGVMKSDDLATRNEIYALLGNIREPWATALLLKGLANERGEDRAQAIISLGETGDPDVAIEIERFHNTQGLVFATLEALGKLGNEKSQKAVEQMLDHEEPSVRIYAAIALWRLGDKGRALQTLDPLITSDDPVTRVLLAEELADVDDLDARGRLATLAEDADGSVRLAAIRSVASTATPADRPTLLTALQDKDYQIVSVALSGLAKVGDRASLDAIVPLMSDAQDYTALSAAVAALSIAEANPPEAS